jgi:hypothetical protein
VLARVLVRLAAGHLVTAGMNAKAAKAEATSHMQKISKVILVTVIA